MRALIVDTGSSLSSLAGVRALADRGWWVGVGSPSRPSIAARSRGAQAWHDICPPNQDYDRFVKSVGAAIQDHRYDIVFGSGDADTLAISLARAQFAPAVVPYPPHAQLLRALDKHDLTQAAQSAELATPATFEPTDDALAHIPSWPVVVKARLHYDPGRASANARLEAVVARDRDEAARRLAEIRLAGCEPVLQEAVPGHMTALNMVLDREHKVIARVQQRAERMFPPDAGVAARAVTVDVDDELAGRAAAMLAELGWTGLVQLQFLESPDGQPRLIDLNPRFYLTLALAGAAGPNLAALWASVALGEPVRPVPDGAAGVRFQWLEGDARLALGQARGSRLRDLAGCLRWWPGSVHSTWRADDPRPTLTTIARRAEWGRRMLAAPSPTTGVHAAAGGLRALIVDPGSSRQALAAVRALAEDGWTVSVGSPMGRGIAARSRFTRWREHVPAPNEGYQAFIDAINTAVDKHGYSVVFGAEDAEVLALSWGREGVRAEVPYPDHSKLLRGVDKLHLAEAARTAGIPTPGTTEATNHDIAATARWPVIVKARLHSIPGAEGAPARMEASFAGDPSEAERQVAALRALGGEPILQEVVEGELGALIVLLDREQRVVARVQQRAERTFPAAAGVSARAVTVEVDDSLAERAANMLVELGWTGLAELQFMQPRDGEPYLIDLNARFYGSIPLAIASGVNLPALWARIATGQPVATLADAPPGVRFQWLEGDLRAAWHERRGGVVADLLSCVRWWRDSAHDIWQTDDPLPAMTDAAYGALRIARRVASRFTA